MQLINVHNLLDETPEQVLKITFQLRASLALPPNSLDQFWPFFI